MRELRQVVVFEMMSPEMHAEPQSPTQMLVWNFVPDPHVFEHGLQLDQLPQLKGVATANGHQNCEGILSNSCRFQDSR